MGRLDGKVALFSGGARGQGTAEGSRLPKYLLALSPDSWGYGPMTGPRHFCFRRAKAAELEFGDANLTGKQVCFG